MPPKRQQQPTRRWKGDQPVIDLTCLEEPPARRGRSPTSRTRHRRSLHLARHTRSSAAKVAGGNNNNEETIVVHDDDDDDDDEGNERRRTTKHERLFQRSVEQRRTAYQHTVRQAPQVEQRSELSSSEEKTTQSRPWKRLFIDTSAMDQVLDESAHDEEQREELAPVPDFMSAFSYQFKHKSDPDEQSDVIMLDDILPPRRNSQVIESLEPTRDVTSPVAPTVFDLTHTTSSGHASSQWTPPNQDTSRSNHSSPQATTLIHASPTHQAPSSEPPAPPHSTKIESIRKAARFLQQQRKLQMEFIQARAQPEPSSPPVVLVLPQEENAEAPEPMSPQWSPSSRRAMTYRKARNKTQDVINLVESDPAEGALTGQEDLAADDDDNQDPPTENPVVVLDDMFESSSGSAMDSTTSQDTNPRSNVSVRTEELPMSPGSDGMSSSRYEDDYNMSSASTSLDHDYDESRVKSPAAADYISPASSTDVSNQQEAHAPPSRPGSPRLSFTKKLSRSLFASKPTPPERSIASPHYDEAERTVSGERADPMSPISLDREDNQNAIMHNSHSTSHTSAEESQIASTTFPAEKSLPISNLRSPVISPVSSTLEPILEHSKLDSSESEETSHSGLSASNKERRQTVTKQADIQNTVALGESPDQAPFSKPTTSCKPKPTGFELATNSPTKTSDYTSINGSPLSSRDILAALESGSLESLAGASDSQLPYTPDIANIPNGVSSQEYANSGQDVDTSGGTLEVGTEHEYATTVFGHSGRTMSLGGPELQPRRVSSGVLSPQTADGRSSQASVGSESAHGSYRSPQGSQLSPQSEQSTQHRDAPKSDIVGDFTAEAISTSNPALSPTSSERESMIAALSIDSLLASPGATSPRLLLSGSQETVPTNGSRGWKHEQVSPTVSRTLSPSHVQSSTSAGSDFLLGSISIDSGINFAVSSPIHSSISLSQRNERHQDQERYPAHTGDLLDKHPGSFRPAQLTVDATEYRTESLVSYRMPGSNSPIGACASPRSVSSSPQQTYLQTSNSPSYDVYPSSPIDHSKPTDLSTQSKASSNGDKATLLSQSPEPLDPCKSKKQVSFLESPTPSEMYDEESRNASEQNRFSLSEEQSQLPASDNIELKECSTAQDKVVPYDGIATEGEVLSSPSVRSGISLLNPTESGALGDEESPGKVDSDVSENTELPEQSAIDGPGLYLSASPPSLELATTNSWAVQSLPAYLDDPENIDPSTIKPIMSCPSAGSIWSVDDRAMSLEKDAAGLGAGKSSDAHEEADVMAILSSVQQSFGTHEYLFTWAMKPMVSFPRTNEADSRGDPVDPGAPNVEAKSSTLRDKVIEFVECARPAEEQRDPPSASRVVTVVEHESVEGATKLTDEGGATKENPKISSAQVPQSRTSWVEDLSTSEDAGSIISDDPYSFDSLESDEPTIMYEVCGGTKWADQIFDQTCTWLENRHPVFCLPSTSTKRSKKEILSNGVTNAETAQEGPNRRARRVIGRNIRSTPLTKCFGGSKRTDPKRKRRKRRSKGAKQPDAIAATDPHEATTIVTKTNAAQEPLSVVVESRQDIVESVTVVPLQASDEMVSDDEPETSEADHKASAQGLRKKGSLLSDGGECETIDVSNSKEKSVSSPTSTSSAGSGLQPYRLSSVRMEAIREEINEITSILVDTGIAPEAISTPKSRGSDAPGFVEGVHRLL